MWLAGFLLLGMLLGSVGPLLVAWQYHLTGDPRDIGFHFLALSAGYASATYLFRHRANTRAPGTLAVGAALLASAGLIALAFATPPEPMAWRVAGLLVLGIAAGTLAAALFQTLQGPGTAMTANAAGAWFSCGCLLSCLLIGSLYTSGHEDTGAFVLACMPIAFLLGLGRRLLHRPMPSPVPPTINSPPARLPATVLIALLLFFQFGNEWAIAGWLPLFLIRRLGSSPTAAILTLAAYFLFLVVGRQLGKVLLAVLSPRKLLLASTVLAMAGYALLARTGNFSGAYTAVVVIGLGFGPIYPLVAENHRPGFYNGVFSVAITAGMATPWLLGYACHYFGMQSVVAFPAVGSVLVCVLALLLMLEAHLMSDAGGSDPGVLLH